MGIWGRRRAIRWFIPALAAGVFAAPAAARPMSLDEEGGLPSAAPTRVVQPSSSRVVVAAKATDDSFGWTDAGIGAGGALALITVAAGGAIVVVAGRGRTDCLACA